MPFKRDEAKQNGAWSTAVGSGYSTGRSFEGDKKHYYCIVTHMIFVENIRRM